MSNKSNNLVGSIIWMDLTVQHAVDIKNFYRKAIGWEMTEVNIGEYSDYSMVEPSTGKTVAGICHARGSNANLLLNGWSILLLQTLRRASPIVLN